MTPLALRLHPGESAPFRVTVRYDGRVAPFDHGWVVWRGARGSRTAVPVAITR